jgi:alpha-glucoside transport system permease protein
MTGMAQEDTSVQVAGRSAAGSSRMSRLFNRLPLHLTIVVIMAVWLIPTFGLFVNSFRSITDMSSAGWWTALFPPSNLTLDSYKQVLDTQGVAAGFVNSLIITIPATVIQIFIATMAGYAFAWMRFPGRDFFFILIVLLLVVPIQMTLIPVLRLFAATGLAGSFVAVCLPSEVFESAEVDGASHVQKFWRIGLPMIVPAVAAITIFVFLGIWNDLLVALTYMGSSPNRPLTVVITQLVTSFGGGWQFLTAAAVLQMILPLAVFLGLQRYFVRGISAGSVKG